MKLLIDQNLSHRLVKPLQEPFPGTEQVRRLGLTDRRDTTIWDYARQNGFVILTQDEDFADLSSLRGAPPKVVLLRTGNLPTAQVIDLLHGHLFRTYAWRLSRSVSQRKTQRSAELEGKPLRFSAFYLCEPLRESDSVSLLRKSYC